MQASDGTTALELLTRVVDPSPSTDSSSSTGTDISPTRPLSSTSRHWLMPPCRPRLCSRRVSPGYISTSPSEVGPNGPRKEIIWQKREKSPVDPAIFPDRDGRDEDHCLAIDFSDSSGEPRKSLSLPVHVVDQDQNRAMHSPSRLTFHRIALAFSRMRRGEPQLSRLPTIGRISSPT